MFVIWFLNCFNSYETGTENVTSIEGSIFTVFIYNILTGQLSLLYHSLELPEEEIFCVSQDYLGVSWFLLG